MPDAGRLGLEAQRGVRRTSQEGTWLCAGWKSDGSQQEVKAESESAGADSVWQTRKGKESEFHLSSGSGGFY